MFVGHQLTADSDNWLRSSSYYFQMLSCRNGATDLYSLSHLHQQSTCHLQECVPGAQKLLAACRDAGITIVHTLEAHKVGLSDIGYAAIASMLHILLCTALQLPVMMGIHREHALRLCTTHLPSRVSGCRLRLHPAITILMQTAWLACRPCPVLHTPQAMQHQLAEHLIMPCWSWTPKRVCCCSAAGPVGPAPGQGAAWQPAARQPHRRRRRRHGPHPDPRLARQRHHRRAGARRGAGCVCAVWLTAGIETRARLSDSVRRVVQEIACLHRQGSWVATLLGSACATAPRCTVPLLEVQLG